MAETDSLPEIGSLWIGERLSALELVCLKSFADAGHHVTLYHYGDLLDRPDFVELRDAREIWDDDRILTHADRGSPAIHSDIFRIKMIRLTGKIWADADQYCIRPFKTRDGYLFAPVKPHRIGNSVLALPPQSPALAACDEFLSSRGARPPWWTDEEADAFLAEHGDFGFEKMRWGSTGPIAFDWFVKQSGEAKFAAPAAALYPIPPNAKTRIFKRPRKVTSLFTEDTLGAHFFASGVRDRIIAGEVSPGSYFGVICAKHGIDLHEAPAPQADPASEGMNNG